MVTATVTAVAVHATPRSDSARAPFYNPMIKHSLSTEIHRFCVRLGNLNLDSAFARQTVDVLLTELGVDHNDIFSYTKDEIKTYIKGISLWMKHAPRSVVENCHDTINTFGYASTMMIATK